MDVSLLGQKETYLKLLLIIIIIMKYLSMQHSAAWKGVVAQLVKNIQHYVGIEISLKHATLLTSSLRQGC